MESKNQAKLKNSILKVLKDFIKEEFNNDIAKAANYFGEDRQNIYKYLNGKRRPGLDKLMGLLDKMKKYEFIYEIR